MKKAAVIFLTLILCFPAFASATDIDLSGLTTEELIVLKNKVEAVLSTAQNSGSDVVITSRKNPAAIGQPVVFQSQQNGYKALIQIVVHNVFRGKEVATIGKTLNDFGLNDKEKDEHIAVDVSVEFLHIEELDENKAKTDDPQLEISVHNFKIISGDGTLYDNASIYTGGVDMLSSIYEGATTQGYLLFAIKKADAAPNLLYSPDSVAPSPANLFGRVGKEEIWISLGEKVVTDDNSNSSEKMIENGNRELAEKIKKQGRLYEGNGNLFAYQIDEKRGAVNLDAEYGILDISGNIVSEPQWEKISFDDNGFVYVTKNEKQGVLDAGGITVIEPQWDYIGGFHEGLSSVITDGKWGYVDTNGTVVIEPQWDSANSFSEGLALVKKDTQYGFVDTNGTVVIEPQWDVANSFSEGLALVKKDNQFGFIDTEGNIVIEPQWNDAYSFSEGLAAVQKGEKWGYIDREGTVAIKPQWDKAYPFKEGTVATIVHNGKYGFVDIAGKVIKPQWDDAEPFSEGLAAVKKGDKWGFIDYDGKIVMKPQWEKVGHFSEGLAPVKKNNKWGFINTTGKFVFEPQWNDAVFFDDGIASVCASNGKWGCIDTTGNYVIEPIWNNRQPWFGMFYRGNFRFKNGIDAVQQDGEYSLIDKEGNIIW